MSARLFTQRATSATSWEATKLFTGPLSRAQQKKDPGATRSQEFDVATPALTGFWRGFSSGSTHSARGRPEKGNARAIIYADSSNNTKTRTTLSGDPIKCTLTLPAHTAKKLRLL